MTLMLASVLSAAEAEIALAGGADIIDLKNPAEGALGALAPAEAARIVQAIGGRAPCSAVIGDLPMQPAILAAAAARAAATGVDFVKIGFFPDAAGADCVAALAPLAKQTRLIGVLFADLAPDFALAPLMAQAGFHGLMLDTAQKDGRRLLDHLRPAAVAEFLALCRVQGLMAGLSGSLEAPDIPRLLSLAPDFLGFRGALCAQRRRGGALDPAAFAMIRAMIPPERKAAGGAEPAKADLRLLAARGYWHGRQSAEATDRVFVRDLILPMQIGAYDYERSAPQKVRFNVEAEVLRAAALADDMRGVFSYDVIRDAIGVIAQRGHIAMVETLAEEIAQIVLQHERVASVMVRVEKLEIIDGALGVEIRRTRKAEQASVQQLFAAPQRRP